MNRIILYILTLFLFIPSVSMASVVLITVKESDGVARSGEYIRRGIPLPKDSGCTSTSGMKVTTDLEGNTPIAAQFHIISRWDTNGNDSDTSDPVRVVLVVFKTAVSANSTATYYLHTTGGSGTSAGSNIADNQSTYVDLATGTLTARLKKTAGFNFFEKVTVDSVDLVSSPTSDGIIARYNGVDYTSYNSNVVPSITIHYNGPLMACVSVAGDLQSAANAQLIPPDGTNGISYKVYFWVYKDERIIRPVITIKNENNGYAASSEVAPMATLALDYLYIRTSMAGMGTPTAVRFGAGESAGAAYSNTSPSGVYVVDQDHPDWANDNTTQDDFAAMSYKVGASGSETNNSSDRFNSYSQIRDANRGLMVGSRWFWQEYWKRIELDATNKRVDFYLWPDKSFTHPFVGGIWKSTELIYNFHGNVASNYTFVDELAAVKNRVRGYVSTEFTSEYFYRLADLGVETGVTFNNDSNQKLDPAIRLYEKALISRFDNSVSDTPGETYDLDDMRRIRGFTWDYGVYSGNYASWYGWLNFGDAIRDPGMGPGAQNYDWNWMLLAGGLQSKRNDLMEIADQFSLHYGDKLIIHDPNTSTAMASSGAQRQAMHGGQRGETDPFGFTGGFKYGSSGNQPADHGHNWASGYLWGFLLYGDPIISDVAEHIADHAVFKISNVTRVATQPYTEASCNVGPCYVGIVENRQFSRTIPILVDLWKIKGNVEFINLASSVFTNGVLTHEYGYGSTPLGFNDMKEPYNAWVFYDSLLGIDLIQLWRGLNDMGENTVKPLIQSYLTRQATWVKDELFDKWPNGAAGTYSGNTYFPYQVPIAYSVVPSNLPISGDDGSYTVAFSQVFAFLWENTNNSSWLDLARAAYKDSATYMSVYSGAVADYQPIITADPLPFEGMISPSPGSAWLKYAKQMQAAMYLPAVESKRLNRVSGKRYRYLSITNN